MGNFKKLKNIKNLLGFLSCLLFLFFGGSLFAEGQGFNLGNVLIPVGGDGLGGQPYSNHSAGTITFDTTWTNPIIYSRFSFYNTNNCSGTGSFMGQVFGNSFIFSPGTSVYKIDGAKLYVIAAAVPITASSVQSFSIFYSNDVGGTRGKWGPPKSNDPGSPPSYCPCYSVTHGTTDGIDFYAGSGALSTSFEADPNNCSFSV